MTLTVRCIRYACTLSTSACVARQTVRPRKPKMDGQTNPHARARVPDHLVYCASGECAQGRAVREGAAHAS